MLHAVHSFLTRPMKLTKIAITTGLAIFFLGIGSFTMSSPALASSKIVTPEALDMAISEAAQKFVDSILDDYADILEGSFDTAYDPLKSAVKGVNKQVSKANKPAKKGAKQDAEAAPAPEITIASAPFEAAAASFKTLQEQTAGFQTQLENAPTVIEELIESQLGVKMDELNAAFATVAEAVDQIVEDTATLSASDPDSTAAFTEHATMLTQAVKAADMVIDSFDS